MRISDWSSDVCSSDLASVHRSMSSLRRQSPAAGVALARIQAHIEIGRASCRERVCQYVEISAVAVSLKNKIEETSDQRDARHEKRRGSLSEGARTDG